MRTRYYWVMLYVGLLSALSVQYGRQKRDSRQGKMENTLIREARVPVASGFNLFLGDNHPEK